MTRNHMKSHEIIVKSGQNWRANHLDVVKSVFLGQPSHLVGGLSVIVLTIFLTMSFLLLEHVFDRIVTKLNYLHTFHPKILLIFERTFDPILRW